MILSIIAGIGKNNEIGKANTLLWHLPADMKHFKDTTTLHAVIMGRKTFESIGRALPNRRNIVITRDVDYLKGKNLDIEIAPSLQSAIALFEGSSEEVFVIGGAEIYEQAMPYAEKLYITHVDGEFSEADAFFPIINQNIWHEISREKYMKDSKNIYDYTFVVYEKIN